MTVKLVYVCKKKILEPPKTRFYEPNVTRFRTSQDDQCPCFKIKYMYTGIYRVRMSSHFE